MKCWTEYVEILKNLELREKAAAVALAVGMVALGYQMAEDYLEHKVDEWFEEMEQGN